jgi:hypothetical protein
VLSVLDENREEGVPDNASVQSEAELWATVYHLQDDVVTHCAGDNNSPLRSIIHQIAVANAQPSGGHPTYALIDPRGVIRYYQAGIGLNLLQAQMATFTGITLDQDWDIPNTTPSLDLGVPFTVAPVGVTAKRSDGVAIHETLTLTDGDIAQGVLVSYKQSFLQVNHTSTDFPGFDVDTPITLRYTPTPPPPVTGVYRLNAAPGITVAPYVEPFDPNNPFDFRLQATTSAPVSFPADGSIVLACPAISSFAAGTGSHKWPLLLTSVIYEPSLLPFAAIVQLKADVVADTQLSGTDKAKIGGALDTALQKLGQRDFVNAAAKSAAADAALSKANANAVLRANADSLASSLASLTG